MPLVNSRLLITLIVRSNDVGARERVIEAIAGFAALSSTAERHSQSRNRSVTPCTKPAAKDRSLQCEQPSAGANLVAIVSLDNSATERDLEEHPV